MVDEKRIGLEYFVRKIKTPLDDSHLITPIPEPITSVVSKLNAIYTNSINLDSNAIMPKVPKTSLVGIQKFYSEIDELERILNATFKKIKSQK